MPDDEPPLSPASGESSAEAEGLPVINPDEQEQETREGAEEIGPARKFQQMAFVALGGSAGAIEAISAFLKAAPVDAGIGYAVVMHLSPEHESTLPQLLQRSTAMPVQAAEDRVRVQPDTVYVIPPGKHLTMADGHLRLSPLEHEHGKRVAVDLFLRSLAETHGPRAISIIFSGADGDGAIGLKRIKERGGLTIAQEPDEAEHSSMPRSAIATGMVDWVLKAEDMPAKVLEYLARERRLRLPPEEGPQPSEPAPKPSRDEGEAALREVLVHLRTRTGRDFTYYKRGTILRRIARRMQVSGVEDLPAYLGFLRTHPGETGVLLKDLLISVTNFFRDREAFATLEMRIPELFAGKTEHDVVRVWVPAVATGEEAYSIAMLLLEHARTLDRPPMLQVFGCDLDEDAIRVARAGIYPETIAADVSEERLRRWFVHERHGFRVQREVREILLFAAHDVVKDAPFSRMDLISCRNLLIYLNTEAQARLLDLFHFALRPNGLLFLGSSESIEEAPQLFTTLDKKYRVFRHQPFARISLPTAPRGSPLRARAPELTAADYPAPILPGRSFSHSEAVRPPLPVAAGRAAAGGGEPRGSWRELHFRMLERAGPPSLVINGEHEIVHMTDKAGQFLQLGGGEPSTNLLRLIRPELRIELRAALFRAAQTGQPAESFRVPFPGEGEEKAVNIRVTPMNDLAPGFLLVVLELKGALAVGETAEPTGGERLGTGGGHAVSDDLDNELQQLKTHLRDTVEQHVADEEELKASNEELQAMNEELRSASEELETSREELQSLTEELSTVNQELKSRLEELGSVNGDLRNLMSSTQIATVFLDRELRIMRFTPSAVPIFNLIETDLGRPLTHLKHELEYPELEQDARGVLDGLAPMEREMAASGGRTFLARVLPYRTVEDRIAGVVLNFVNITERKRAEQAVQENEQRLRTLADAVPQLIWANDGRGRANYFNLRWYEYTGLTFEESAGPGWEAIVHPDDAPASKARWAQALAAGQVFDTEYRLRGAHGKYRWFIGRNVPMRNAAGQVTGWFGTATDIQALKEAEAARRAGEEQFRRAIEGAPIPVIVQAEDGQVLQISRTWTELTGFTREELPTFEAWLNRAYGPGAEEVREHVRRLFQDDEGRVDADLDVATASGAVRRWSFSASAPGRLSDGRRFIVGMALDITERQRAEEALRASEERFRVALEAAEMAAWDLDTGTGVVIWNIQHYRLLGLEPDGQPKTAEDFFRRVHPDDAAMVRERLRIATQETGVYQADFRILRSDDQSIRWMSGFGRAIAHEGGRARRLTGVMFDTTERHLTEASLREAEERVRLVVENARDFAIFATDLERRVTSWNPGAEAICGYGEAEIIGQSGDVIFTPEDRAACAPEGEAETALTHGRATDERWHLRKDGTRFWGSGVMMAMHDPAGRAIGMVKILRDMTEAREAQQALEESREDLWRALQDTERARAEAEAAGQAKDHFLAVLSHELRTPLTPVIMAVRTLARRKDLPAPVAEALQMIQRNVQLEAHFVDDLLDLTRVTRGKMELVREPLDLHEVVRHALEVSRPDFEAKGQRLEVALSAGQHALNGDAKRLQQVFWNLAKNAAKFTPEGGLIRVLSRNDASRIIVEVHDSGIGFAPEDADRIFDAFTQASAEVTRQFGGLGLGLAISKATVLAHDGTISAWSPGPGQGAILTVSLPCA